MNFLPSLFLYNPLEAVIIILAICYASNIKLKFSSLVINSYVLGFLNLIFQYAGEQLFGYAMYAFITMSIQHIVLPLMTYFYFNYVMKIKIGVTKVFVTRWLFSISVSFFITSADILGLLEIYVERFEFIQELIANLSVRVFQLILIGLLYLGKRLISNERSAQEVG